MANACRPKQISQKSIVKSLQWNFLENFGKDTMTHTMYIVRDESVWIAPTDCSCNLLQVQSIPSKDWTEERPPGNEFNFQQTYLYITVLMTSKSLCANIIKSSLRDWFKFLTCSQSNYRKLSIGVLTNCWVYYFIIYQYCTIHTFPQFIN